MSEAESKMINDDVGIGLPDGPPDGSENETAETPSEECEASCDEQNTIPPADTKSHLKSSVPRAASAPCGAMSKQEIREARELFSGLDDAEIQRLYKKVTQ